jgi:hypothetical protein
MLFLEGFVWYIKPQEIIFLEIYYYSNSFYIIMFSIPRKRIDYMMWIITNDDDDDDDDEVHDL